MRFGHIELFVRDASKSRRFFEEVLGFEVTSVQAEGRIVWLQLGGFEILLRPGQDSSGAASYREAESAIVLYTDNLEETLSKLQSRGLELRGDDGPGCPTFTDPDGHWFQLACPQ